MHKPNILFLFPDQHRGDWLKCASPDLPLRTPVLDALAARGMRFTNAYTPSPVCGPARTCLATGKSYARNPVKDHSTNMANDADTLYQRLRQAGYRTGSVGKLDLAKAYHNWHGDGKRFIDEWGFTDGFDSEGKFDGSIGYMRDPDNPPGPYLRALKERGVAELYAAEHRSVRRPAEAYITGVPEDLYNDNWVGSNGLAALRDFPLDQPWFLQVSFPGPHDPNDVTQAMHDIWKDVAFPQPHRAGDTDPAQLLLARRHYAAMIENIDRQCGRLLDLVEERGELENTIIVYSSDHGEMLGDHGRWHKCLWYEPSVCVPLIMAGPGVEPGVVTDAMLTTEDLAPTLIEATGADPLQEADAQSFWQVLSGKSCKHRAYVNSALTFGKWFDWRMVCDGHYKYVAQPSGEDFLYDLEHDPWEDRNVIADVPHIAKEIRKLVNQY